MRKLSRFLFLFVAITVGYSAFSLRNQSVVLENKPVEVNPLTESSAEKLLKNMTLDEKIAQLLVIRVQSDYSPKLVEKVCATVSKYQVGGVCFFKGSPQKQVALTNRLQALSAVPLLVTMDAEWGVAMRLDSCTTFPKQIQLGALKQSDNALIYEVGKEIAQQCKALGVHVNFAPAVDVNNNPNNPVINYRSFGELRELVAEKGIACMKGLQENGIMTCAKHFPGHGDTDMDSHYDLPSIHKTRSALDSLEFYPFRKLIDAGVDMVMVAHLNVPALDSNKNAITSLSYPVITNLLRQEMGFSGIIITDGMEMLGLRKSYPKGAEAEILALLAGVDMLLLPNDPEEIIPEIRKAVENGTVPIELINEKCLKVLKLKERHGLKNFKTIPSRHLEEKLNSANAMRLVETINAKTLTLLKNENSIIPVSQKGLSETALLYIGAENDTATYKELSNTCNLPFYYVSSTAKMSELWKQTLSPYSKVLVVFVYSSNTPKNDYGLSKNSVKFIQELAKNKDVILSMFGNPYALNLFDSLSQVKSIILGYNPTVHAVKYALQALQGQASFEGKLPVSLRGFPVLSGITLIPHGLDEDENYSAFPVEINNRIDSIISAGIRDEVFPGCQIIAVHQGNVVFHQCYGYHTYQKKDPVTFSSLYDVASLTKPAATALAVMKLYDEGKIKLNDPVVKYLSYLKNSNKEKLTIAELLTHTSGLQAFIPFYKKLIINNKWDKNYLNKTKTDRFTVEVAKGLFLDSSYIHHLHQTIADSKSNEKQYLYSDLGFLMLQEIVEQIAGETMEAYLDRHFYRRMNLDATCFNPLAKGIPLRTIAPTEQDHFFRKQLVHGYVHDQTAALMGGVCGNAGLFSNTRNLAVIFQMLMNGGSYDGYRYLAKETVELFTKTYPLHNCYRRALGFDTPNYEKESAALPKQASPSTYGHLGFTGTAVWCDPDQKLLYIFLSNRVYPDTEPNKLSASNIRVLIHQAIYEGLQN
jgi:beta-glucosidase-like glycosyl hydrolase/CubicO group peptidase (beta-lactamase class C family)